MLPVAGVYKCRIKKNSPMKFYFYVNLPYTTRHVRVSDRIYHPTKTLGEFVNFEASFCFDWHANTMTTATNGQYKAYLISLMSFVDGAAYSKTHVFTPTELNAITATNIRNWMEMKAYRLGQNNQSSS